MNFAITEESLCQPQKKKKKKQNEKNPEKHEGLAWETKKECVIVCIQTPLYVDL